MAKDLTTTVYEPITPEGLARSLMCVTIIFTVLSSIVVCLRMYVRITTRAFATEDWLMLAAWLLNLAHNAFVILLSISGIGSHDDVITVGMQYRMGLYTILWQVIYVTDGALIKSAIIWTLLRLANQKVYKYILWGLFGFSWIVWQISWPVAIFQCRPVSAAWGEPGDCTSGQKVILSVTYFVSAANICTDVSTAIVPILLLRHAQMVKRLKIVVSGILSLGVVASVATIIRLPYSYAYTATTDKYYTIGNIVLWTVIECDLGIIAGSMPMLRHLFKTLLHSKGGSRSADTRSADINMVTIGGGRRTARTGYKLESSRGATKAGMHSHHFIDNDSNDDDESTRHIIHVTKEVEIVQEASEGHEWGPKAGVRGLD